jgi:hypothetical protein
MKGMLAYNKDKEEQQTNKQTEPGPLKTKTFTNKAENG